MNFWDQITGNDMTRAHKILEARAAGMPAEYRVAWEQVKAYIWPYSDFTGRNLVPILGGVIDLLEESAAEGLSIQEVLGDDIKGFCAAIVGGDGAKKYRDRWREQLNNSIAKKLGR